MSEWEPIHKQGRHWGKEPTDGDVRKLRLPDGATIYQVYTETNGEGSDGYVSRVTRGWFPVASFGMEVSMWYIIEQDLEHGTEMAITQTLPVGVEIKILVAEESASNCLNSWATICYARGFTAGQKVVKVEEDAPKFGQLNPKDFSFNVTTMEPDRLRLHNDRTSTFEIVVTPQKDNYKIEIWLKKKGDTVFLLDHMGSGGFFETWLVKTVQNVSECIRAWFDRSTGLSFNYINNYEEIYLPWFYKHNAKETAYGS